MIGSLLGFSFGIIGTMDIARDIRYQYSSCSYGSYPYYYTNRTCIQMFAMMAIETFLCFGKSPTRFFYFVLLLFVPGVLVGIDERVETFFSLRMRHHAGRPTTGHCSVFLDFLQIFFSTWKLIPESNSSPCERSNHTKIIKIHREKPSQTLISLAKLINWDR